MTTYQTKAFDLAKQRLDPSSRFYAVDLADLKSHYSRMSDSDCIDSISRFMSTVTERELRINCQFDGLPC